MDIKQLARSLGVTQQLAISRATELLRLLKLRVPGSLGQGEICRPAVCLELACQTTPGCKLPVREEYIRYSCSAPKVYNEMFTRIQRLLDVRPAMDLRELIILFGCSQLHDDTKQLLNVYKSRFLESLSDTERTRADLTRPSLLAAAFLLIAKKHRARIDRGALTAKMGLTRAEVSTALEDFNTRCKDQLVAVASRKRGPAEGDTGPEAETDDISVAARSTTGGVHGGTGRGANHRQRPAPRKMDDDDDGPADGTKTLAVAVDDFKLVLMGLVPSGAASVVEERGDSHGAGGGRKAPSRRKIAQAGKGNKTQIAVKDSLPDAIYVDGK